MALTESGVLHTRDLMLDTAYIRARYSCFYGDTASPRNLIL